MNIEKEVARMFLSCKSIDWKYESEWRCIRMPGNGYIPIVNPRLIDGIIFGWKMEDKTKDLIKAWIADWKPQPELFDATPSKNCFAMIIKRRDGDPESRRNMTK